MGDKFLEMLTILTIKDHYFRPNSYKSPIEQAWYIGRTLADLTDRHVALFQQNAHPIQLLIYEEHNKFLRYVHNDDAQKLKAVLHARIKELEQQREKSIATNEGESLSPDDHEEIHIQAVTEWREEQKFAVRSRDRNGDFNDYLETRRPFGTGK